MAHLSSRVPMRYFFIQMSAARRVPTIRVRAAEAAHILRPPDRRMEAAEENSEECYGYVTPIKTFFYRF